MINYYLILKPGIIFGNLVAFTAGFILALKGAFPISLFFLSLLGLGLIIAAACVFNNYIDRDLDKKMSRTRTRPLAKGKMHSHSALIYGGVLLLAGNGLLYAYTNPLTLTLSDLGFAIYVFIYSLIKERTTYSTLIGSIAGAMPPVIGYTATGESFDSGALLLFLLMVFWQMPHFFAIGLWRIKDYSHANIPILPVIHGAYRTKVQIVLYILGCIPLLALLTLLGYTGALFFLVTAALSCVWLLLAIRGFSARESSPWAKQMFRFSLVMINAICMLIFLENRIIS